VNGTTIIAGNLTVSGSTFYTNVETIAVQDPIIAMGGGANDTPLLSNDGKDRGIALNYYDTAARTAFVGYDNSTNKLIAATRVNITNEVVTVSTYGTLVVGILEGSNVSITGDVNAGNVVSVGFVQSATVSATGNITGGNVTTGGLITATGNIIGSQFVGSGASLTNLNGSNIASGIVPSARLSGSYTINISGAATTAATVTTAAQPNITSVGTLSSVSATGNITTSSSLISTGPFIVIPTAASNPAGGVEGAMYFNTGSNVLRVFSGGLWRNT
jgi:hypothetical protein